MFFQSFASNTLFVIPYTGEDNLILFKTFMGIKFKPGFRANRRGSVSIFNFKNNSGFFGIYNSNISDIFSMRIAIFNNNRVSVFVKHFHFATTTTMRVITIMTN